MNRILILAVALLFSSSLLADITTYRFVSKEWKSEVNATTCDGKTDGWVCDKAAYDYSVGYKDALYFSRLFRKRKGITPSNYRNKRTEGA